MVHATLEELKSEMSATGLCAGERRTYEKCRSCGQIIVREFIPYGLGRGRTFNPCMCYLTGNDKRSGYDRLEEIDGPLPWPGKIVAVTDPQPGESFLLYGVAKDPHEEH